MFYETTSQAVKGGGSRARLSSSCHYHYYILLLFAFITGEAVAITARGTHCRMGVIKAVELYIVVFSTNCDVGQSQ